MNCSTSFKRRWFRPFWPENIMERIKIEALPRRKGSKGDRKELRRRGLVPAIIYGRGVDPLLVSVDSIDLKKALSQAGANVLLDMEIKDNNFATQQTVIVKELQRHSIQKDLILHADFLRISMEDKLEVNVPLHFTGEARGVKGGGVLQVLLREVAVRCLPADIPEYINVEVDDLDVGDALTVADLKVPPGVELLEDPGEVVVSVLAPAIEEEAVEEEEVAEAAPVEEEKKEE